MWYIYHGEGREIRIYKTGTASAGKYQPFSHSYSYTLNAEVTDLSEMLVFTYQSTQHHVQESYNHATHHPEDIYSHIRIYLILVDSYMIYSSFAWSDPHCITTTECFIKER